MNSDVAYLKSDKLALRHGFFTRHGGVSPKPYDSLNMLVRVGDTEKNVVINRARALAALKLKSEDLALLDHLEHSDKILAVSEAAQGLDFDGYDAIMTNEGRVPIGLCVADCAAVILASEKDGAIGIAHSGWRGTRINIVPKLVEAMIEEYSVDPANLIAVIGPHHTVSTYEIGEDVAKEFDARYIQNRNDKLFLDVKLAIEDQLVESGVRTVDSLTVNTFTDDRFYSYRRENGDTGRFLVVASL